MSHACRCVPSSIACAGYAGVSGGPAAAGAAIVPLSKSIPPLHWWRRLPATSLDAAHVAVLRRAIGGIGLIREPHWPAAANGDATAAVAVALRALKRHRKAAPTLDLVMSALLCCAIEGSSVAAAMLGDALAGLRTRDPAHAAVIVSWQAVARQAVRERPGD